MTLTQRAVTVLLEDRLITFNRAVGLIRRRNLPVRSIAVGPTVTPGVSRLTIMIHSDEATADRAVQHLQKVVGVREAVAFPARDGVTRELALVKVRAAGDRYGELLDGLGGLRAVLYPGTRAVRDPGSSPERRGSAGSGQRRRRARAGEHLIGVTLSEAKRAYGGACPLRFVQGDS
jgi:acetolactate synthase small subunit